MSERDSDRVNTLLASVEDRETKTHEFLQEKSSGFVEQTILQLAKFLHISERKAKEYFRKEWATGNITIKSNLWEWIADGGHELESQTPFTDYAKRKELEKLRQKHETEKTNETKFTDDKEKKFRATLVAQLKKKPKNEIKEDMIANGICNGNNCPPFSQDSCEQCSKYVNLNRKPWSSKK